MKNSMILNNSTKLDAAPVEQTADRDSRELNSLTTNLTNG